MIEKLVKGHSSLLYFLSVTVTGIREILSFYETVSEVIPFCKMADHTRSAMADVSVICYEIFCLSNTILDAQNEDNCTPQSSYT